MMNQGSTLPRREGGIGEERQACGRGDSSFEDAAADAVPAVGALRIFRGAALVDNHRVALDTAVRVVVADVEGAASPLKTMPPPSFS